MDQAGHQPPVLAHLGQAASGARVRRPPDPALTVEPPLRALGPVDDRQCRVADRVRQDRPELFPVLGTAGHGAQPLQGVPGVQAALKQTDEERHRQRGNGQGDHPRQRIDQLRARAEPADPDRERQNGPPRGGHEQDGEQCQPGDRRGPGHPLPHPDDDRQVQDHGQQLPDGHHHVADEGRLGADEERVGGAACVARRVWGRGRKGAVEQGGGQVEDDQERDRRARQQTVDPQVQPAGREGQDQSDQPGLDHPARDTADAVDQLVGGLRERREEPPEAGHHQEAAEAVIRAALPDIEADPDRHGHHRRPGHPRQRRAFPLDITRGHGRGHDGGRQPRGDDHDELEHEPPVRRWGTS